MAQAIVTHTRRADNICAVQTLTDLEVQAGDTVVIANVHANFDGTFTVLSTEPYYVAGVDQDGYIVYDYAISKLNQIIYAHNGDDEAYMARSGTATVTHTVTWITAADVLVWLGIDTATANDTAFVTTCVNASNAWCYRKRREAGYIDSASTVPSADVKLGATIYAATLYRERGSVDSFASFDSMAIGASPSATLGRIMQLLGCGRAQVA